MKLLYEISYVKFGYYEKATKFEKKIVAFSEYLKFISY